MLDAGRESSQFSASWILLFATPLRGIQEHTYRIRQVSISYSKQKAKERRSKMTTLEAKLNDCQKICDQDPSPENMNMFEVLKTEFELQNDYITQGAIIRTNASHLVRARRKKQQIFILKFRKFQRKEEFNSEDS